MQPQNNKISVSTEESDDCLSPKELVNRHLQDKDHKISDEDLEKVALDCTDEMEETTAEITSAPTPSLRDDDNNRDDDDDKEEKDVIITPLDVIS